MRDQLRELMFIMKTAFGRFLMCELFLVVAYNPWLSITTWLYPQMADTDRLASGWPVKVVIGLLAIGFLATLVITVKNSMGFGWTALVVAITALLGYLPFYFNLLNVTDSHILNVVYFFMMPTVFACGLSAGHVTRYLKGTLLTQSVGGHAGAVQAHGHTSDAPTHHA